MLLRIEATALAASLDREHTASKASAARFFELANHDTLTGLANRAAFSTNLNDWLERCAGSRRGFYLFLLDLDHFKSINDTLGHSAGDDILKEAAKRLSQTIEANTSWPGWEATSSPSFWQPAPASRDRPAKTTKPNASRCDLLSKVSGAFHLGEHAVSIGVSIGVAKYPDDGETVEDLLAHADLALYAAKDGGRHRWRRFDASLLADATMARDIEHDSHGRARRRLDAGLLPAPGLARRLSAGRPRSVAALEPPRPRLDRSAVRGGGGAKDAQIGAS